MKLSWSLAALLVPHLLLAAPKDKEKDKKGPDVPEVKVPEPPELLAARQEYQAAVALLQEKLAAAFKTRGQKYVADLQALETQLAGAGQADALALVRQEREAYAGGQGDFGFAEGDKKVPPAVKELRRSYEADLAKLHAAAVPAAKPVADKYAQKLGDLERTFVAARNADGILALQKERKDFQGVATNPLYGGDESILGKWHAPDGHGTWTFEADGKVRTNFRAEGNWKWLDRAKRTLFIDYYRPGTIKDVTFTVNLDGWGLVGKSVDGAPVYLNRAK